MEHFNGIGETVFEENANYPLISVQMPVRSAD
jgi:hypothetical protein